MIDRDSDQFGKLQAVYRNLSQRHSRRSFISAAMRVTLGVVGVTTVYQLIGPVSQSSADSNCNDCTLCGLCGRPCDACGGTLGSCPAGTAQGTSYWSFCCGCGSCATYRYYDCCGNSSCSATKCQNNCEQPAWCSGSGYSVYNCTLAIVGSSCGPC